MANKMEVQDQEKFQDLYTIFVSQGVKLAKAMLKKIQPTPESIAQAILAIVTRLEQAGEKNGLAFDLPVIFNGSKEILIYIISQLGMEPDENFVKQTVGLMVGKYLNNAITSGKMTKEEAMQLAEEAKSMGTQQEQPQAQPGATPPQQAAQPQRGMIASKMGGALNG